MKDCLIHPCLKLAKVTKQQYHKSINPYVLKRLKSQTY